jgi:hypothetical protein
MRRREFTMLVSGATVVCPLAGRAQQADRKRRVGVPMGHSFGAVSMSGPSRRRYQAPSVCLLRGCIPVGEFNSKRIRGTPKDMALTWLETASHSQHEFIRDCAHRHAGNHRAAVRKVAENARVTIAIAVVEHRRRIPLNPKVLPTFARHGTNSLVDSGSLRSEF